MPKPTYKYTQTPHVEKRKEKHPAAKPAGKLSFNERIGLGITSRVGTMWAAYVFFALTLVSLPAAIASGDTIIMVSWVAQTFLQLVLLPIIIVGQNLQAKDAERRAIATYEDASAILDEAREIQSHLSDQDKALSHLIDRMEHLESGLSAKSKSSSTKPAAASAKPQTLTKSPPKPKK